jgi:hypothetical protein
MFTSMSLGTTEAENVAEMLQAMSLSTTAQELRCNSPGCTNRTTANSVYCKSCLARMDKK